MARLEEKLAVGRTKTLRPPGKGTQFPELMDDKEKMLFWWQDKTIRETRMVYSLEEIWDFFSHELDKRKLIEGKLKHLNVIMDDE
jgi:hypothetical protein